MFPALAQTATASGVRVSWSPRSTPVPASTASMAGAPSKLIRRYVIAPAVTAGDAPNACTMRGASGIPAASTAAPIPAASHSPSIPSWMAARRFPAPSCRATAAVVP